MVARWRRPSRARRAGTVPPPEIPVGRTQQAWRSARPLRRALSEPVPPVIAPGFTNRLATWRLAEMTVATRPVRTWTCLTPLTPSAWTRRRSGALTSADLAAARLAPDAGSVRWRSVTEPGADLATAPPRPSFAGPLRRASAAWTPDAARPGRPRTGLGPALPGLPRSARPLGPDLGEPPAPTAPSPPYATGAPDDLGWPAMPGRPGPLGPPAGTAPTPADASAYPRAGIGPMLASLPPTARPLSPVAGGSPPPLPPQAPVSPRPAEPAPPAWAAPRTSRGSQEPRHGLPVVHRFEQAGQAGPVAAPTAGLAPPLARSGSVPGGQVPPGPVTIGSSGPRFSSAQPAQPVNAAALAREIARHHGDELAKAVAPALARLLRPPRNRTAERDESPAELPR